MRTLPFLLAALLGSAAPRAASAAELATSLGMGGAATDWSGDKNGFGSIKVAVRGWDLVSAYFLTRIGYGSVDSRLVTYLSVGSQLWGRLGWVRPYVRLGLGHQHEESMAAARRQPWGALFGVGDGIRHRAGLEGGAGVDFPFKKTGKWELLASVDAFSSWFTNSVGPSWFFGAGLSIGFHYSL